MSDAFSEFDKFLSKNAAYVLMFCINLKPLPLP